MEATRSPFRQIDCRILCAFLVLFAMSVLVESVSDLTTSAVPPTPDATPATKYRKKIVKSTTTDALALATVPIPATKSTSKWPLATPSTKHSKSLSSSLPSKQRSVVTHVAPTQGKKTSALNVVTTTTTTTTTKVSHPDKKPTHILTTDTSDLHTSADQKASDNQTSAVTPSETSTTAALFSASTGVPKSHWTSGELTTSNEITPTPKIFRPRSKGRPGQMTTPGQGVPDSTQTPDMTHGHGISETLSTETGKITVASVTTVPSSTPEKSSAALIIAIVLLLLLALALLLACLYCRRRRRSGSTSFSTGWAGQVALPDDTGLDKDEEQGPLTTGEKEPRRATLTTFFGKRQSRAASVAMEEIDGKEIERKEEARQLIDGNTGKDASPLGPGEANGKVPEPTQEETPPTQAEKDTPTS